MPKITSIHERLVFNSRGDKTVEVDVVSDNQFLGRACAPSGASVGMYESQSFLDNNPQKTIDVFKNIKKKFIGLESNDLKTIHDILKGFDSSTNYSNIGGSIAYALTISCIDSASKSLHLPFYKVLNSKIEKINFPFPLGNMLGGGAHAGHGTPDLQEFLVCPVGAKSIFEALEINVKIHKQLKKDIEKADPFFTGGKGDEGAWAPNLSNDKAIEILERTVNNCGYDSKKDVRLGIDFASSTLWNPKKKIYEYKRHGKILDLEDQLEYTNYLINQYDLIYAEDPLNEEDFDGMSELTKKNPRCLVTGDDLLVTNKERVAIAAKKHSCSGAILKVNQAGSLYDALLFAKECDANNIKIVTSHRSGESTDSHISHIAIATNSIMLKCGVVGGERISKLNELIRISEYGLIEGMAKLTSI
ncbi:MAG: enolase [Nitrosopumilus sp.]|nr:enolase [Nitrosopumilus sp.]